jgi:hypothetical protein
MTTNTGVQMGLCEASLQNEIDRLKGMVSELEGRRREAVLADALRRWATALDVGYAPPPWKREDLEAIERLKALLPRASR